MDIQTINSSEICPKGIVEQLLEIAEKHNCINEIGNATSWRWKEGIISRMPKKNTVAKILKSAFKTEDPSVWLESLTGELRTFVTNAFDCNQKIHADYKVRDIYDTLFLTSLVDHRGIRFEEAVFRLGYIRFCKNGDFETDELIEIDESMILKIYGDWAERKALELISFFNIKPKEDGYYKIEGQHYFTDPNFTRHQDEIVSLRFKAVGGNSHFDMWRNSFFALSDDEMIAIEKKISDFEDSLVQEMRKLTSKSFRDSGQLKTRLIRMNCSTLPVQANEELKWQR